MFSILSSLSLSSFFLRALLQEHFWMIYTHTLGGRFYIYTWRSLLHQALQFFLFLLLAHDTTVFLVVVVVVLFVTALFFFSLSSLGPRLVDICLNDTVL